MRHQPATILLLATLTTTLATLAACDPSRKSIGSLDGETGESSSGDGDGDSDGLCGPSLIDLEFEVDAFGIESNGTPLFCSAEVVETSGGYQIFLNDCADAQGPLEQAAVTITLEGGWDEPLVGEHVEMHYVALDVVINQEVLPQRWLSLRSPGVEQPLSLVAVDAISTYPSTFAQIEFDYAPFAIDVVETDCPLIEGLACAPIQPGALNVWSGDQEFMIPEGQESEFVFDNDSYHVVVEKARELVDDCPDDPPGEYEFSIVARP
jgi:hypothetical protein